MSKDKLPYCISFDTKDMAPLIKAVKVDLSWHFMRKEDTVRVDLVDHPLYKHLYNYCKANPPNK